MRRLREQKIGRCTMFFCTQEVPFSSLGKRLGHHRSPSLPVAKAKWPVSWHSASAAPETCLKPSFLDAFGTSLSWSCPPPPNTFSTLSLGPPASTRPLNAFSSGQASFCLFPFSTPSSPLSAAAPRPVSSVQATGLSSGTKRPPAWWAWPPGAPQAPPASCAMGSS